jgi:hypothetical protein
MSPHRLVALVLAAVALLAAAALAPVSAGAQQDLAGYDGSNPFLCELQFAGEGTEVPDPDADPFCVEYDKTRQDLTDMSIVEFLGGEPQRLEAASDKCFYYQRDRWRSRAVAGQELTETYSWDGAYFLDRAAGRGGAYAESFTVGGEPAADLSPILPERYGSYFSEGRGGLMGDMGIEVDPRCVALACEEPVYRGEPPPQVAERCAAAAPEEPAPTTDGSQTGGDGGRSDGGGTGGASRAAPAGRDVRFSEARRVPRFTG